MTAIQVLIELGIQKPTNAEASRAAFVIRKRNGARHRKSNGRSLLLIPPQATDFAARYQLAAPPNSLLDR
jgi:hypothetical protein